MTADALYSCKKHHIDWQEVLADGSLGLLGAIIINPGLNGGCAGGMSPPSITTTENELPLTPVPEPATAVMMLIAAGVMAIRRRVMPGIRAPKRRVNHAS
jgi:hypothetical protein